MADEQPQPPRVPPRVPPRPSRKRAAQATHPTPAPGPPEAPADLKGWLLRLAATKTPPVGSGAAALALWTAWVAHLVRPSLRDWFHGAAGLMLVVAIFYNRVHAMGQAKLRRERRRRKDGGDADGDD